MAPDSGRPIGRRKFLAYSAATCAALYLGWEPHLTAAAEPADVVLINGKIITFDAEDHIAQAVAIKGDEIVAVGSNAALQPLVGPDTNIINLRGKAVTPGIIDSHLHALYYGRMFWEGFLNVRFPALPSLEELLDAISDRAATLQPGEWVSGNQGFFFTTGPTHFDKHTLDAVAPNNPVYLRHWSGQYSIVNSKALEVAGIDVDGITPNPYGGVIVRDPDTNEATGQLLHYPAENLVMSKADGYHDLTDEVLEGDLKRAQEMMLSSGITSGQDVIVGSPHDLGIYRNLDERGELKMRMWCLQYLETEQEAQNYAAAVQPYQTDFLTFGGWKIAVDGGAGAGTALMYDPTAIGGARSYYYHEPDVLNRMVKLLHDTGYQISFHIIGDKGIDEALDAVQAAVLASGMGKGRHRIEHCWFPTPAAQARIKLLKMVVSVQSAMISWFGDGYKVGSSPAMMEYFMPLKTLLAAGVHCCLGCDVPAAPMHEPKWDLIGATSRQTIRGEILNPTERLTMPIALRLHTLGAAYAAGEEDVKGSIEPGKWADLVAWNKDPLTVTSPLELLPLRAVMTMVGGKVVYEAPDYETYVPAVVKGH